MSHVMRKPGYAICEQQRRISACESTQSDQRLCCSLPGLYKTSTCYSQILWMDGWVRVLRPFNSLSVISRRWKGEYERLCAMKRRLGSGRISPPAWFEPATPWSEVGSANRSATRTLQPNFKTLASLIRLAGRLESKLVANPEHRFSRDVAQIVPTPPRE